MSVNIPAKLQKLSELELGKTYKLEADGIESVFYVVRAGVMPTIIIYGEQEVPDDRTHMAEVTARTVQLLGWTRYPAYASLDGSGGPVFFDIDEPTTEVYSLWYVRQNPHGQPDIAYMASCPEIKPFDPQVED